MQEPALSQSLMQSRKRPSQEGARQKLKLQKPLHDELGKMINDAVNELENSPSIFQYFRKKQGR
jgi:hypothetical protein